MQFIRFPNLCMSVVAVVFQESQKIKESKWLTGKTENQTQREIEINSMVAQKVD